MVFLNCCVKVVNNSVNITASLLKIYAELLSNIFDEFSCMLPTVFL